MLFFGRLAAICCGFWFGLIGNFGLLGWGVLDLGRVSGWRWICWVLLFSYSLV